MLGFIPISKKIHLLFGGELDKIFLNLLDGKADIFLDEIVFSKLMTILDNPNPKYAKKDIFDTFLRHINKTVDWQNALRITLTLHKLIHHSGDEILEVLNSKKCAQISDFKPPKNTPKNSGHHLLVSPYFTYVQKLAYCYQDLTVCFTHELKTLEKILQRNNMTLLHFLSKVQNILRTLLKILPFFESSMYEFKAPVLVKQALYFCLTDCQHFYSHINKVMDLILQEIFYLSPEDALFLFEIYCEHVAITNRLKSIFDMKNLLHDFYLEVPEFYVVDPMFNSEVELHVADLKKGHVPKKRRKTSTIILLTTTSETQNDLNDEGDAQVPSFKSLQVISRELIESIRSLTTIPDKANEKSYYKTPKFYMRKKGQIPQPKIKFTMVKESTPTARNKEGDKVTPTGAKSASVTCVKLLSVPLDIEDRFSNVNPDLPENIENPGYSLNLSQTTTKPGKALLIPNFSPNPSPSHRKNCRSLHNLSPAPLVEDQRERTIKLCSLEGNLHFS